MRSLPTLLGLDTTEPQPANCSVDKQFQEYRNVTTIQLPVCQLCDELNKYKILITPLSCNTFTIASYSRSWFIHVVASARPGIQTLRKSKRCTRIRGNSVNVRMRKTPGQSNHGGNGYTFLNVARRPFIRNVLLSCIAQLHLEMSHVSIFNQRPFHSPGIIMM